LPDFKNIVVPLIENGTSIIFWHDPWAHQNLSLAAPELFSFAKNKMISVHNVLSMGHDEFSNLFQLPLSQIAFLQMQNIQHVLSAIPLSNIPDKWSYSWGSDKFAATKVYRCLIGHQSLIHISVK